jgi:hypothetical protein
MADAVLRAGPFALRPAHSTPLGAVVHCRRWSRDYRRHPSSSRWDNNSMPAGKAAEQLCGILRRQPGPGYWAWSGV